MQKMYKTEIWDRRIYSVDPHDEKEYQYYLKLLTGAKMSLSETELSVSTATTSFSVKLSLYEDNSFKTWIGVFPDGNKYRILKPNGMSMMIWLMSNPDAFDGFTIGSLNPQGWSISFKLLK